MPDPAALIAVARLLLQPDASIMPSDAQLRRAASTAYYAVFHKLLRAAAARFVGHGQESTAAFSLIYRGFEHGRMKAVCEGVRATRLSETYSRALSRPAASQEMRDFAASFTSLQDARHSADYDPTANFLQSRVASLIDAAAAAIETFERIDAVEQADVLALMIVGARR